MVATDAINFTCLRSIVQSRAYSVNITGANCCEAVSFSWVNHVWQLAERIVSQLIRVVGTLRTVFRATGNEDLPIICLDGTKSDWNREVLQELFSTLAIVVNIVVSDGFLVEFEEMDSVVLEAVLSYKCFVFKVLVG